MSNVPSRLTQHGHDLFRKLDRFLVSSRRGDANWTFFRNRLGGKHEGFLLPSGDSPWCRPQSFRDLGRDADEETGKHADHAGPTSGRAFKNRPADAAHESGDQHQAIEVSDRTNEGHAAHCTEGTRFRIAYRNG